MRRQPRNRRRRVVQVLAPPGAVRRAAPGAPASTRISASGSPLSRARSRTQAPSKPAAASVRRDLLRHALFGGRQLHAVRRQVHEGAAHRDRAVAPAAPRAARATAARAGAAAPGGAAAPRRGRVPRGALAWKSASAASTRSPRRPRSARLPSAQSPCASVASHGLGQPRGARRRQALRGGEARAGRRPAAPRASSAVQACRSRSAAPARPARPGAAACAGSAPVPKGSSTTPPAMRARGRGVAQHHAVAVPGADRVCAAPAARGRSARAPAASPSSTATLPCTAAAPRCTCTGVPERSGLRFAVPQRQRRVEPVAWLQRDRRAPPATGRAATAALSTPASATAQRWPGPARRTALVLRVQAAHPRARAAGHERAVRRRPPPRRRAPCRSRRCRRRRA